MEPTRKEGLLEKTSTFLDVPADAMAGLPKLELTGDRSLYLERYRGILLYGKEEIQVDGGKWVLRVVGRDLEIQAMREGELRLFGWISRLELV